MSALTKAQQKQHAIACELLEQTHLTFADREFVFEHWRADANQNVRHAGAFFTPLGLAEVFAIECNGAQSVIDLCAGIGVLAYQRWLRDQPKRLVCVERNPAYVAVGKKLLPEAEWEQADVFALPDLGHFDLAVSNPPFGKLARNGNGPRYRGNAFEFHVIDIASTLADQGAFLLPQMSTPFKFSGDHGFAYVDHHAYQRFERETGIELSLGVGIDTSYWLSEWQGAKPLVESVRTEFAGGVAS